MSETNQKVIVVGDGTVGSTYAHGLVTQNVVDEIGILDVNTEKAQGDALDLMHALPYMSVAAKKVYQATYADVKDANIVTITANAPSAVLTGDHPDRLLLLKNNVQMIKEIVENVVANGFQGIFLIASNPVDIITRIVQEVSGFPKGKVIGTGTLIDTARMKRIVGDQLNIDPRNIHGYVFGEHGASSFAAWDSVFVGTLPIKTLMKKNPDRELISLDEMDQLIRDVGFTIHKKKGATYYGIAGVLVRITTAILRNEQSILPVSAYLDDDFGHQGLYIGVPAIVDGNGVRELINVPLSSEEQEKFAKSVKVLETNFDSIKDELK